MLKDRVVPKKVLPRGLPTTTKVLRVSKTSDIASIAPLFLSNAFPLIRLGRTTFASWRKRVIRGLVRLDFFAALPGTKTSAKEKNTTRMSEQVLTSFQFGGLHEQK